MDAPIAAESLDREIVDAHQADARANKVTGSFHTQGNVFGAEPGLIPEQGIVRFQQKTLLPPEGKSFQLPDPDLRRTAKISHEGPAHEEGKGYGVQGSAARQLVTRCVQVGTGMIAHGKTGYIGSVTPFKQQFRLDSYFRISRIDRNRIAERD
jgi:hypothetical protein